MRNRDLLWKKKTKPAWGMIFEPWLDVIFLLTSISLQLLVVGILTFPWTVVDRYLTRDVSLFSDHDRLDSAEYGVEHLPICSDIFCSLRLTNHFLEDHWQIHKDCLGIKKSMLVSRQGSSSIPNDGISGEPRRSEREQERKMWSCGCRRQARLEASSLQNTLIVSAFKLIRQAV